MAVCPFSEQTLFSALALRKLGREEVSSWCWVKESGCNLGGMWVGQRELGGRSTALVGAGGSERV